MWVKICGVCDLASARVVVDAGADALGLNFVARSKRRVSVEQARFIADAVRGHVELVGVVEDCTLSEALSLRESLRLDSIQIHSTQGVLNETELPDWAYAAVGLAGEGDARRLEDVAGRRVLVDACVGGKSGGTGETFDWNWVTGLAKIRTLILAGGLQPSNVARAVATVRPFGVDVASGVELAGRPGIKDPELAARFVAEARSLSADSD